MVATTNHIVAAKSEEVLLSHLPVASLSVDSLMFEVVQRCYRNSLVACFRSRLAVEEGDSWDERIRKAFRPEEWAGIESSAVLASATGALARAPKDSVDLLSVNHFYNIVDLNYEALIPESNRGQADTDRIIKQNLLKHIKGIKDVRDPLSHPPEEDVSPFDALNLVHAVLSVFRVMGIVEPVVRVTEIRTELARRAASTSGAAQSIHTLEASLPTREEIVDSFVGRSAELEELWKWLSEPTQARWVLVGDGGKGKSAVAYQFGDTVRRSGVSGLSGVFWLSAKKRQFEDGVVRKISAPDFHDLDSALNKLLGVYGYSNLSTKSTSYKEKEALNLLEGLPSLVIVDDIDSIEAEDEDVVEFFTYHAPRTGSKILMTSRRLFQGMSKSSTVISGMAFDDASIFLLGMIEKMGIERPQLPQHFHQIVEMTEGSPLYMEDVLRLCRHLSASKAIEKWKQHAGDAARRYALERELDLLSKPAREIIDTCCLSNVGFTVAQLERITGHGEDAVIAALRELEKAYLVPGSILVDGEPAFTVNHNLRWLIRRRLAKTDERALLQEGIDAVVGSTSVTLDAAVDGHIRQIRVLASSDRESEAVAVAEAGMGTPRLRKDPLFLAAVAHLYASVDPPRMADAREVWLASAKEGLTNADAYIQWCSAEERNGHWHQLREAADIGIENCERRRYVLRTFAARACSRIGQLQKRSGTRTSEFDRAKRYLDDALDEAFAEGTKDEISTIFKAHYMNARAMASANAVTEVLKRWLNWKPRDQDALEALKGYSKQYPVEARKVQSFLADKIARD